MEEFLLAMKALDLALTLAPQIAQAIDIARVKTETPEQMKALLDTMDAAVIRYTSKITTKA
jgi:hypothetical protein